MNLARQCVWLSSLMHAVGALRAGTNTEYLSLPEPPPAHVPGRNAVQRVEEAQAHRDSSMAAGLRAGSSLPAHPDQHEHSGDVDHVMRMIQHLRGGFVSVERTGQG